MTVRKDWPARWRAWASHHRVHVGIFFAVAYVAFSRTDPVRLPVGALMVAAGEGIRVWACGYLQRNRVVARDGPYRLVRHPLYLGSLLIGSGLAVLAEHWLLWLVAFIGLYLGFYLPAMHVEELRLQSLFGPEYQEYMDEVPRLIPTWRRTTWPEAGSGQRFRWRRAVANREMRTVVVMTALVAVQALKLLPL